MPVYRLAVQRRFDRGHAAADCWMESTEGVFLLSEDGSGKLVRPLLVVSHRCTRLTPCRWRSTFVCLLSTKGLLTVRPRRNSALDSFVHTSILHTITCLMPLNCKAINLLGSYLGCSVVQACCTGVRSSCSASTFLPPSPYLCSPLARAPAPPSLDIAHAIRAARTGAPAKSARARA